LTGNVIHFPSDASPVISTFDSVEIATKAKDGLDGADIYAGCCTLRIEYAKVKEKFPLLLENYT
jgi:heterogeneous nuclear ribonucleoprotein L